MPDTPVERMAERVAEVLRDAELALSQSTASMVAFMPHPTPQSAKRACERNVEVLKRIADLLTQLPPRPPLTPEQEARAMEAIGRALRTFGD